VELNDHARLTLHARHAHTRTRSSADDNGWAGVGYNNPYVQTPTLDALAKGGLTLTAQYVYQYCAPTRGSFLTGRYPWAMPSFLLPRSLTTLPATVPSIPRLTTSATRWMLLATLIRYILPFQLDSCHLIRARARRRRTCS
jgi:hypothetical protein